MTSNIDDLIEHFNQPQASHERVSEARQTLGLTLEQLGLMLGYQGNQVRQMMHRIEMGERELREPQRRLLAAYLEDYRPKDWPS